jgi:hypothetical protein
MTELNGAGRSVSGMYFVQVHVGMRHRPRRRFRCITLQLQPRIEHGGAFQL